MENNEKNGSSLPNWFKTKPSFSETNSAQLSARKTCTNDQPDMNFLSFEKCRMGLDLEKMVGLARL